MAQQAKLLATNPDNRSSIPRTHTAGKLTPPSFPLTSHSRHATGTGMATPHTHNQSKKQMSKVKRTGSGSLFFSERVNAKLSWDGNAS